VTHSTASAAHFCERAEQAPADVSALSRCARVRRVVLGRVSAFRISSDSAGKVGQVAVVDAARVELLCRLSEHRGPFASARMRRALDLLEDANVLLDFR
jgi:hypothetical protein